MHFIGFISVTVLLNTFYQDSTMQVGKNVFLAHCNSCHKDTAVGLAPAHAVLSTMTSNSILVSLEKGKMQPQAARLSEFEKKAVAQWVANEKLKDTKLPAIAYTEFKAPNITTIYDHSGWGNNLGGTGYRTAEQSGISGNNIGSLELKWAFAFPGASSIRSKPAVMGDWIIVNGLLGDVSAIHRQTGKVGWQFNANSSVRGAVSIVRSGNAITAYFTDYTTTTYAVDVRTGKAIWQQRAGFDPLSATTGSVAVYSGIVYVPISSLEISSAAQGTYACCVSSGGVVALDARTGKRLWNYRITPRASLVGKSKRGKLVYGPSGAPVWCSPTIDAKRGLLYIGTGENYSHPTTNTSDAIQALDLKTGKLKWNYQATPKDAYNSACPFFNNCPDSAGADLDFGMAPLLVKRKDGKEILVAGQKSGVVHALSPENGKLLWQTRIGKGGALGGIHWGMATDGHFVYATNSDQPYALDKSDSSRKPSPGLYALDLMTGKIVWQTPTPACDGKTGCLACNSAAPLVSNGLVWAGGLDGHIRAYAAANGKIVWDYDTVKEYDGVNGVKGKGGAIDGPPPVIANGMLFVNSGYNMFGQMGGNVLLAFEVKNK